MTLYNELLITIIDALHKNYRVCKCLVECPPYGLIGDHSAYEVFHMNYIPSGYEVVTDLFEDEIIPHKILNFIHNHQQSQN